MVVWGNGTERIKLRVNNLIMSQQIIHSLRLSSRIEEANYGGSCRRNLTAFYGQAPYRLTFYNNILYWRNNSSTILQTNRTTGYTTKLLDAVNRIVDIGIAAESRNGNS